MPACYMMIDKHVAYDVRAELGGRTYESNGRWIEEKLFRGFGESRFCLRVRSGRETPPWAIRRKQVSDWHITLKPLTVAEAKAWVKEHLAPEAYEYIFEEAG